MNYVDIGIVAQEAAIATRLPIQVAFVYLNCNRWEISFRQVGADERQFLALIDLDRSDDRDTVQYEIERQLIEHYAGELLN
jgi:hypothetical protein